MIPLTLIALIAAAPAPPAPPFPDEVQRQIRKLGEPSATVRFDAITQLRLLARRVNISGGQRIQRGEPFDPKVKGLVPYLIRALKDEAESNRMVALHALADTRDPAAAEAIRKCLKDEKELVRFHAACLLTEFKDASGLKEMKAALGRLRADPMAAKGPFDTELLLASFERITGKSFGEIPLSPFLQSNTREIEASQEQIKKLLDAWAAWWDWEPAKK